MVHAEQLRRRIAFKLPGRYLIRDFAEYQFISTVRLIFQVICRAWCISACCIKRGTKHIKEPAVNVVFKCCKRFYRLLRIRQQQICMSAAAVNTVRTRNTDASQNCIYQVLHQQFQIERACAQRFQRTVIRNGINKILYAGNINAVQEERLFPIERCCLCKQPLPIVCHSLCIEIFPDAAPECRSQLAVVKQRNICNLFSGG